LLVIIISQRQTASEAVIQIYNRIILKSVILGSISESRCTQPRYARSYIGVTPEKQQVAKASFENGRSPFKNDSAY